MVRSAIVGALVLGAALALPAYAQQTSSIAGVVRDTSGAVLPGVTVEATSPVLIEKVRTVVSDEQGRYNITDLVPGTYRERPLQGFSTVRRGSPDIGIHGVDQRDRRSVSGNDYMGGASPIVDTSNVRRQTVVEQLSPPGHN
jgi:hypothetical protein